MVLPAQGVVEFPGFLDFAPEDEGGFGGCGRFGEGEVEALYLMISDLVNMSQ